MSSRVFMIDKAEETLRLFTAEDPTRNSAIAVVNTLLPEITSPDQLYGGVPEGSILIVEVQAGARAVRWEDGHLHGNLRADQMPMDPAWVLERYGPMTVVLMP